MRVILIICVCLILSGCYSGDLGYDIDRYNKAKRVVNDSELGENCLSIQKCIEFLDLYSNVINYEYERLYEEISRINYISNSIKSKIITDAIWREESDKAIDDIDHEDYGYDKERVIEGEKEYTDEEVEKLLEEFKKNLEGDVGGDTGDRYSETKRIAGSNNIIKLGVGSSSEYIKEGEFVSRYISSSIYKDFYIIKYTNFTGIIIYGITIDNNIITNIERFS